MSTFTQIYSHIVYSTKNRMPVLKESRRKDLYGYIWGILKNKRCHLYRIGGVDDHIHMLTSLHPTVDLASLIRDMKTSTTTWIRKENVYPRFPGWQEGYGAFTKSHADKDRVIGYITRQAEHHKTVSFIDELRTLLHEEGIVFDERYLE
jgi:REP element-mobilizing transposase RayT